MQPIIDERNYTVVGINGYRQGNLTRLQAVVLAYRKQREMQNAGWAGRMRVYYRDGLPVDWEKEPRK